jgi:mRNA-degrading endonuclease RelE of RelBE toxin-antitoxin system
MPAAYTVRLTPSFQRELERLPPIVQRQILHALTLLGTTPKGPHPKIKKLHGKAIGQWRLEVWPYRVRYDVLGRDVPLYRVRHRKEIYRD